jgi:cobalamin biosynthesis protein CobT
MDISKSGETKKEQSEMKQLADVQDGVVSQTDPAKHTFSRRWDRWWGQREHTYDNEWYIVRPRYAEEFENLKTFTFQERQEILSKREILSSLAHFIGKDFRLPVHLGAPGSGWYWDPVQNSVTIDSQDVLSNPLSFLRFVTCHEGGHRRISRLSTVPDELVENGAFMMLLNGVEDPRINNYLCEAYPVLERDMKEAISHSFEEIHKVLARAEKDQGMRPDSVVAVQEIIAEWFSDRGGKLPLHKALELSAEVKEFLKTTRAACQRAYYTYPSRKETERGDRAAKAYSKAAYRVIAEEVWPHFQSLVQKDMQTSAAAELFKQLAASAIQEAAKQEGSPSGESAEQCGDKEQGSDAGDSQQDSDRQEQQESTGSGGEAKAEPEDQQDGQSDGQQEGHKGRKCGAQQAGAEAGSEGEHASGSHKETLYESVKQRLSEGSLKELDCALDTIKGAAKKGEPTEETKRFSELSDALKRELAESMRHLPDGIRQEMERLALEFLEAMQREVADQLKGQLSPQAATPAVATNNHSTPERYRGSESSEFGSLGEVGRGAIREDFVDEATLAKFRDKIREVLGDDKDVYHGYRKQVLGVIDTLERDLRRLFQERRASKLEEGKRFGPDMDLDHRISECASGVAAAETRSFARRTRPMERDYAISILVDLSGSMRYQNRMSETFKATVALSEVLNRLGINFEVLGFNDSIHEYKPFHKRMGPDVREKMATMPDEIDSDRARYNDDGWALSAANERLGKEKNDNRFLIVLSDGRPEPSNAHAVPQFELKKVIREIRARGNTILIGLGIGGDTGHVSSYYPNSVANIVAEELPAKLAEILEQAIRHPEKFAK